MIMVMSVPLVMMYGLVTMSLFEVDVISGTAQLLVWVVLCFMMCLHMPSLPAKEIRKRFPNDTIDSLSFIKWWEKPIGWIETNADDFSDVDSFFRKHGHKE